MDEQATNSWSARCTQQRYEMYQGISGVLICRDCGGLVIDPERHDRFHSVTDESWNK